VELFVGEIKKLKRVFYLTRQLSYRKEDRAMRPVHGCPEKFWESSLRRNL